MLVEWEHHQPSQHFDIIISDLEQSSVIQRLSMIEPNGNTDDGYAYLVNDDAVDAQSVLLCFTITVATDALATPPSSGQTAEDLCPKKCLPSVAGQSKSGDTLCYNQPLQQP